MNKERFEEFSNYLKNLKEPLNMTHSDLEKLLIRQREIVMEKYETSYNKLSMLHSEAMEELRRRNDKFLIRDSRHYNWLCSKWTKGEYLDILEGFTDKNELDEYIDNRMFDEMVEGDKDE